MTVSGPFLSELMLVVVRVAVRSSAAVLMVVAGVLLSEWTQAWLLYLPTPSL